MHKKGFCRLGILAVLVVIALALFGRASADPVTFTFTGRLVEQVGFTAPPINFTGAVITLSYTFESNTLDSNPDPSIGEYEGALISLAGTVTWGGSNSFTFSAIDGDITVENNSGANGRDYFLVVSLPTDGLVDDLSGYEISRFQLTMGPVPGNPNFLTSDALPSALAPFGNPTAVEAFGSNNKLVFGVPEPTSLLLLGAGLMGLGLTLRKRR